MNKAGICKLKLMDSLEEQCVFAVVHQSNKTLRGLNCQGHPPPTKVLQPLEPTHHSNAQVFLIPEEAENRDTAALRLVTSCLKPKFQFPSQSYGNNSEFSCLSDHRLKIQLKRKSCPARFSFFRRASYVPGFAGIHNTFLHKHLESTLTQSRSSKAKWPAGCLSLQPLFEACPILTGLTSSQVFLERADSHRAE